jgi:phosphatidylinositol 4-kinase
VSQTQWSKVLQTAWRENPAVAVHLAERLNDPQVTLEIQSLVRARPKDVIEVHEALYFLLGNRMDPRQKKDLKVRFSTLAVVSRLKTFEC